MLEDEVGALAVLAMLMSPAQIRATRRNLDWTQEHLAEEAGCSRNRVVLIERGLDAPVKAKILAALRRAGGNVASVGQ